MPSWPPSSQTSQIMFLPKQSLTELRREPSTSSTNVLRKCFSKKIDIVSIKIFLYKDKVPLVRRSRVTETVFKLCVKFQKSRVVIGCPIQKALKLFFQAAAWLFSKKKFQLTLDLSFSGETTIRETLKCDKSDEITRRGKGPKISMLDGGISFCNATESHSVLQPLYIAPVHSRQVSLRIIGRERQ